MKSKILSSFLAAALILVAGFVFVPVARGDCVGEIEMIDMGGGNYYNTCTGMNSNSSDPNATCGSGGVICASSLNDYNNLVNAAENQEIIDTIVAAGGSASSAGVCTGNINTDVAAAQDCANKAQAQAEARGYTASCTVERVNLPFNDPNTGEDYYLNTTCTVNNSTGHAAYLLAGYQAAPGSNAIITNINPGWGTLATELAYESSLPGSNVTSGTGSGGSNTTSSGTGSSGSGAGSASQVTAYVNNLTKIVNMLITKYKTSLSSIGSSGASSNTGSAASGALTFPVTVTVNADVLNARSAPNTSAYVVTQFMQGNTFSANSIVDGENVEGTTRWWVTMIGTMPAYVWSGGANVE